MTEGVLIIGATGAIGSEVARQITARGGQVFLAGRSEGRLGEVASEVSAAGHAVIDAADGGSFAAAFKDAKAALGTITGVANCVGSVLLKGAHITTDEEWHETIRTNLDTAFYTVRESAKALRPAGGSVVLCSTAAAQVGLANHEAIAAAKAGIDGLVRSAAATYGAKAIRINSVAPGLVKSEMTRRIWENEPMADASREMHVLGRLGEPADVARAIAFLLHPQNDWITGQTLGVDGGLGGIVNRPKR